MSEEGDNAVANEVISQTFEAAERDTSEEDRTVDSVDPSPPQCAEPTERLRWHCFGPLMQARSESSRRTSFGRSSFGVCLCGAGTPRTHEVGCASMMFPANRNAGPWRCAILPADSDGEAEATPTAPPEPAVGPLDETVEQRTRSETISVTTTCSPSPMDSHDTEAFSSVSKASPSR